MNFLIIAGFLMFLAIILYVCGASLESSGRHFESLAHSGTGVVAGYDRSEHSNNYILMVRLKDASYKGIYCCVGGIKVNKSDYPIGTELPVIYAPVSVAGIDTVEVHMREYPPANDKKIGTGMKVISYIVTAIAVVSTIYGFIMLKG